MPAPFVLSLIFPRVRDCYLSHASVNNRITVRHRSRFLDDPKSAIQNLRCHEAPGRPRILAWILMYWLDLLRQSTSQTAIYLPRARGAISTPGLQGNSR